MAEAPQPMSTDEALKIVLELAEQNMIERDELDDDNQEWKRQDTACAIVRVAFRIH